MKYIFFLTCVAHGTIMVAYNHLFDISFWAGLALILVSNLAGYYEGLTRGQKK